MQPLNPRIPSVLYTSKVCNKPASVLGSSDRQYLSPDRLVPRSASPSARIHADSFHTSQKEALFVFMKSRCDMILSHNKVFQVLAWVYLIVMVHV